MRHVESKTSEASNEVKKMVDNIELIMGPIDALDVPKLYKAMDCLVLPSRGEGFGLPILEAMSVGTPVITTGWSGVFDLANPHTTKFIDIEGLEPVDKSKGIDSDFWVKPSLAP